MDELRDEFAGIALSVLLKTEPAHNNMEDIAEKAYQMADAMLAARNVKAQSSG